MSEGSVFYKESAEATNYAREVLNKPGSEATPKEMSNVVQRLLEDYKQKHSAQIEFEEIVGKELEAQGMNCHYAVGRGASCPPRLVVVRYNGNGDAPYHAIVGKVRELSELGSHI